MGVVREIPKERPKFEEPRPIRGDDDASKFDCGKPTLNEFIQRTAFKNEGRASRTYVVCSPAEDGKRAVAAYYCLAAGAVSADDCPGWARRNMPNPIPVIVLGRLAVDKQHARKGLGSAILKEAIQRTLQASQQIGARALIVHAIDDDAVGFYTPFGFQRFPTDSRTLYLPVETLYASL